MTKTPKIESSWLEVLEDEFQKDYFKEIKQFLVNDVEQ
jgi:uracil DNA glycosylase